MFLRPGRREFLKLGGGLAISAYASALRAAEPAVGPQTAHSCILVYLLGGPPHLHARACGQCVRPLAMRGDVEVGSDNPAALLGQLGHDGRTDQAECAGDEHTSAHDTSLWNATASPTTRSGRWRGRFLRQSSFCCAALSRARRARSSSRTRSRARPAGSCMPAARSTCTRRRSRRNRATTSRFQDVQ